MSLDVRPSLIHTSGAFAPRAFASGEHVHRMGGRRVGLLQAGAEIAIGRLRIDDPLQIGNTTYLALDDISVRLNHSCEPNTAIRNEADVFALRDIRAGEELTFDYSMTVWPRLHTAYWEMPCNCGTATCRGKVGDLNSVSPARRQSYIEQGALQDYIIKKVYASPWNWNDFKREPAPPLPGIDHSILLPGGKTGVLLIHGLSGTPLEMRSVGAALAQQGYTVLCPQLAGHCGTFDDLKVTRWHDWIASAEAALKTLAKTCDTIIVGGLSTGAIISLHLAARFPQLVQGTILFAPTLWLNGWMVPLHAYLFNIVLQKPVANLFDHPDMFPHGIKDEAIRNRVKSAIDAGDSSVAGLPITPGGAVLEHRWMVNSLRRDLKWIRQPTLILHPREDDYADLNNIAYLMRNLGGLVETITLDDTYHIITIDRQQDIVIKRAGAFIARVEDAATPKRAPAAILPATATNRARMSLGLGGDAVGA
jgi:carboxylesterase